MPRDPLPAVVVYESHWGSTARIAEAIAQGIGPGARALTTDQATREVLARAALLVAGAPILGFSLPSEKLVRSLERQPSPRRANVSHPPLAAWLRTLPAGVGSVAAFETRIRWSPGSASRTILRRLTVLGYRPLDQPRSFMVRGRYGPLRDGELERARAWGAELAASLRA